jgi:hypothetical protein
MGELVGEFWPTCGVFGEVGFELALVEGPESSTQNWVNAFSERHDEGHDRADRAPDGETYRVCGEADY